MSRSYIAALCSTCSRELDGNGDCSACEAAKPAECHCCGRTDVQLYPWHSHMECASCFAGDDVLVRVAATVNAALVAGPRVMPRRVVTTTGTERAA